MLNTSCCLGVRFDIVYDPLQVPPSRLDNDESVGLFGT